MPTTNNSIQRASDIVGGGQKMRKRLAAAVCSCFVLLALACMKHYIYIGADVKVSSSISVEATFSTVIAHTTDTLPLWSKDSLCEEQPDGLKANWSASACVT